jgi:hypothetical protein
MTDFTSVWDEAGRSAEAESTLRALANAKVASAEIWPFLALAKDSAEFGQRLDLAGDTLTAVAAQHGVPVTDLVAAYTRQYTLLAESRTKSVASQCANCGHASLAHSDGAQCHCGCSSFIAGKTAGKVPDSFKEHQFTKADDDADDAIEGADDDDTTKESSKKTAFEGRPSSHHEQAVDDDESVEDDDEDEENEERKGHFEDGDEDDDERDSVTRDARYMENGQWFRRKPQTDLTSQYYARLGHIKKALDEGVDPLAWIEGENGGVGQPEKPIEHDTETDFSLGYSEVPAGPPTTASHHPFAHQAWFGKSKPEPEEPVDLMAGRPPCPGGHRETAPMRDGSGKHKCFQCDSVFTPKNATGSRHPFI